MADLNTDISKTIAVRHIHLIKDHETPYDRLVALKKFFCPTDAARRRELADKYNTLKTTLRAAKKVEQWLADWIYITAQGKADGLPETDSNRPQEQSPQQASDRQIDYRIRTATDQIVIF
jgi:hypothetical protein